jgi:hypothetical protein
VIESTSLINAEDYTAEDYTVSIIDYLNQFEILSPLAHSRTPATSAEAVEPPGQARWRVAHCRTPAPAAYRSVDAATTASLEFQHFPFISGTESH